MARKMWNAPPLLLLSWLAMSAASPAQAQPPPPANGASEGVTGPGADLAVEPTKGQSRQQQWDDRYACHVWARNQSGFDPSRIAGVPPSGTAAQRDQYRRALIACLEGRGYSVSEAAPPAPPPPPPSLQAATPRYVVREYPPAHEFKYHPLTMQVEGGYTATEGGAANALDDGWNGGLGLTWTPSAALPLSFRFDGSYSRFRETRSSLFLASQQTGTNVAFGYGSVYGGDVDARFDLDMGPRVREYFFGGIGWYREHTSFGQLALGQGERCFFFCVPGYFPVVSNAERSTSGWLDSWNAGMGFEFALQDPASFFIEARYVRLAPQSSRTEFVPIRVGIRF